MTNYWTSTLLTRRRALRRAALAGGGLAALSLVGCGGNDENESGAGDSQSSEAVDSTKGIPGGRFVMQNQGFTRSLVLVTDLSTITSGFVHAGLMELKCARPGVSRYSPELDPELAVTMPEQSPDQISYVFKLHDAKFQNGRAVTSQDVAYSLDRFANWEQSAGKAVYSFIDKVETPDPKTAVVKTKGPFADTLIQLSNYQTLIMAKEFEESPDAVNRYMGAGPFIFVDYQAPVQMRFRKNPDYFQKPYPYFDEILVLGGLDDSQKVATYISGQVDLPWGSPNPDIWRQMKQGRPDSTEWATDFASHAAHYRVDREPFNDKRVRQALSMGVDRRQIRQATSGGEGEDDTISSWVIEGWGFRKPRDLGTAAKYWNYDPAAAKQLMSAAGVTSPIKANFYHADASFLGQNFVDHATLSIAKWKEHGLADITATQQPISQLATGVNLGNYEGMYLWPSQIANTPTFGVNIKNYFFSPPEGVRPPTQNSSFVNNPELSSVVDKQLTQLNREDRKTTLRRVEEILAEEQYWTVYSTYPSKTFTPPKLKNMQYPKFWFGGMHGSAKYWWFQT